LQSLHDIESYQCLIVHDEDRGPGKRLCAFHEKMLANAPTSSQGTSRSCEPAGRFGPGPVGFGCGTYLDAAGDPATTQLVPAIALTILNALADKSSATIFSTPYPD
jgi:hypothetical protein